MNSKLFDLFMSNKSSADLFVAVEKLIEEKTTASIGKENAKFYSVLVSLSNSINNAGWEKRHSDQISLINNEIGKICDEYEEYLP